MHRESHADSLAGSADRYVDRYVDRYAGDPIAGFRARSGPRAVPEQAAEPGLVLEDPGSGFVGAVLRIADSLIELEDRHGRVRGFPLGSRMLLDGATVTVTRPAAAPAARARTASGSFAVASHRARTARGSRIFVEGRHDAELVERVWGDDLRIEGVVVELLEGADELAAVLDDFAPAPGRCAGVLLDHLVPGSKEQRIADAVARGPHAAHTLVLGHPFVDIWQAVKPARLGLESWPVIPRGTEWKAGICAALGIPGAGPAEIAQTWQRILGRVRGFGDLEPQLLGRVEQLIDFVLADGS